MPYIRSGAVVATIYQRPRAQGQMALRMLHEFLAEGGRRSHQVALAPHLVMRGNLDFFLSRQSQESASKKSGDSPKEAGRRRHLIQDSSRRDLRTERLRRNHGLSRH